MNTLDIDPGLSSVLAFVREHLTPIEQAISDGQPVQSCEFAALAGATGALLDAIDARTEPTAVPRLREVA